MADEGLGPLLSALGLVALQRLRDGRFQVLGEEPPWFRRFFVTAGAVPAAAGQGTMFGPEMRSAFLNHFIEDAEAHWSGPDGHRRDSGYWAEEDADGREQHFEAAAIGVGGRKLLVITLAGPAAGATRSLVQSARERSLRLGRQIADGEEARAAIQDAKEQLARRVAERTAALSEANARLTQEVEGRRAAHAALQRSRGRLRSMASDLALAEERERLRIARGVHDDVGQMLAVTMMKFRSLQASLGAGRRSAEFEQIRELLDGVIGRIRSFTFELSSRFLYELGLEAEIEHRAERLQAEHGITVTFTDDGSDKPLAEDLAVTVAQAVRELLFNVAKHASADHVDVRVCREEQCVCVHIDDDGVGFDPARLEAETTADSGYGLFNIRERLKHLGGRLEVQSAPDLGTQVTLVAPLTDGPAFGGGRPDG